MGAVPLDSTFAAGQGEGFVGTIGKRQTPGGREESDTLIQEDWIAKNAGILVDDALSYGT
jgi:hypothetical protein